MDTLLITPDYPPMTGGIQLLCGRLVERSRLDWRVVALSPSDDGGVGSPTATRIKGFGNQRARVAALNGMALWHALRSRPAAVMSGHVVASPAAVAVQRFLGAPAVQLVHALELSSRPALSKFALGHSAATIAVSTYTRDQALALGAPAGRLHVIHPGVDPPTVGFGRDDVGEARRPTVVTVARLEDRYKGFDVLLRALPLVRSRVPDVRWVLVGEGSLRGEIASMASELGVAEAVVLAGRLDDDARDSLLDRADVFAMPSRMMPGGVGGEGFGIVYLEAGAHALPCVAGNVGGAVDAVKDGITGLLVDPTDHVAVAGAITRLLIDRELAARLGKAGQERARSQTWQRMASQVDDLIEELIHSRGRTR